MIKKGFLLALFAIGVFANIFRVKETFLSIIETLYFPLKSKEIKQLQEQI